MRIRWRGLELPSRVVRDEQVSTEQFGRWVEVCTEVFEQVARGEAGRSLEPYASVNPAEFFAVATEVFFDDPVGLRHEHPDLYEVLSDYYRQNPFARVQRQAGPA